MDYGDYIEQITYLLFLKMADERGLRLPKDCDWPSLAERSGTALIEHYGERRRAQPMVGSLFFNLRHAPLAVACAFFCFTIAGRAQGQNPSASSPQSRLSARSLMESADAASTAGYVDAPTTCCGACQEELGFCDTIIESIFGEADPKCWRPLPLSSLFSEGWNEAWVRSPNGSGGAPRQGWINATDANFYRLNFVTFGQGFNSPSQGTDYVGADTLFTPLSRRLLLITHVPFVRRDQFSEGLPIISPTPQPSSTTRGQTGWVAE